LLGLIVLILDVYAIVKIVGGGRSTGQKVLWVVLILLLPLLGDPLVATRTELARGKTRPGL
jgi:hypothetical protein